MIAYRISDKRYAGDISGKGAERYGGRWNRRGHPVVYASFSRALAVLELLVNLKSPIAYRSNYAFTVLEVEDQEIIEISPNELAIKNTASPYRHTQHIAEDCWNRLNALGIAVPSVVLPYEQNIVLNAEHPMFDKRVKVVRTEAFNIEERLQR